MPFISDTQTQQISVSLGLTSEDWSVDFKSLIDEHSLLGILQHERLPSLSTISGKIWRSGMKIYFRRHSIIPMAKNTIGSLNPWSSRQNNSVKAPQSQFHRLPVYSLLISCLAAKRPTYTSRTLKPPPFSFLRLTILLPLPFHQFKIPGPFLKI